jgi:hypothetical protein
MVKIDLDHDKYRFTTENVLDRFTTEEYIIPIKDEKLRFGFLGEDPFLKLENAKYYFNSKISMIHFLQKLSLNATLITTLSNPTLVVVVNEILKNFSSTLNLVIDKETSQILTVNSMASDLISWRKILEKVHEIFQPVGEKVLYLTTFAGLGISIKMNDNDNADLDVIRIEPQTSSSISIYRGNTKEEVPLRGYDEDEILEILKQKLYLTLSKSSALVKG